MSQKGGCQRTMKTNVGPSDRILGILAVLPTLFGFFFFFSRIEAIIKGGRKLVSCALCTTGYDKVK